MHQCTQIQKVRRNSRLPKAVAKIHERERRELARDEKAASKVLTDRIWAIHRERFHTLRDRQATEREAERSHQQLARKDITFARAKDHLIHEIENPPPPRYAPKPKREYAEPTREFNEAASGAAPDQNISRAEQIRCDMEAWRRQNPSRDFGREL